jgi:hypothetical protein
MPVLEMRWLIASTLACLLTYGGLAGAQDWAAAERKIVRLTPSRFSLPNHIRAYLEQRRCTIPQTYATKTPHNVIRGRFTSATSTDVAVLCSRNGVSRILVFRSGEIADVATLAEAPDRGYLQTIDGNGSIGYSRVISTANSRSIRSHSAPEEALPPLTHDGIEDVFAEKGSSILFWTGRRWARLRGSD